MNNSPRHFDTIVIGVGGMGSAICYQLAQRGKRVLGLERFDIPHTKGSSHGQTRIIRLAYYEHPSYVRLLQRAYELWFDIERETNEKLLHTTGSLDAGTEDSPVFQGALLSAHTYDLAHEVLTSVEITKRFPGYRLPAETMGLWQPQGGFLVPERCIVTYVNAAIAHGAEIHGRERTLEYVPTATGGVRVSTHRGVYEADTLIIAAGAWNPNLLPFLQGTAVPERQVLAWLQPSAPQDFTPDRFPVFNLLVEEGCFYGFPVFGIPGFKFGKYHHFEQQGNAEEMLGKREWTEPNDEDEAMLRQFAERYVPGGAGPTMALATCMFTNAPDGHFIIDQHPNQPTVWFISACSGHGFKFASVMGEIMADLVTKGTTRHDISLFRLARLQEGAAAPV